MVTLDSARGLAYDWDGVLVGWGFDWGESAIIDCLHMLLYVFVVSVIGFDIHLDFGFTYFSFLHCDIFLVGNWDVWGL